MLLPFALPRPLHIAGRRFFSNLTQPHPPVLTLQFLAGIIGHSSAMIADAGHSLSDLLSDAVTLWAVRLSRLPPDEDHPYGHGR